MSTRVIEGLPGLQRLGAGGLQVAGQLLHPVTRSASKRLVLWRISVNLAGSSHFTLTGPLACNARGASASVTVRGAALAPPATRAPASRQSQ
jgi:hypothetical protein